MTALALTPARRKALRSEAHHLDPVVMIGADGLTAAVLKEADAALAAHGLVKVRAFSDQRSQREDWLAALTEQLDAAAVQHIGKLLVLWRPVAEKAVAADVARKPGPRIVTVRKAPKSPTHRAQFKKLVVLGNQRVTAGGSIKRARSRQGSVKKASGI